MKITKCQLRKIIQEELIKESPEPPRRMLAQGVASALDSMGYLMDVPVLDEVEEFIQRLQDEGKLRYTK